MVKVASLFSQILSLIDRHGFASLVTKLKAEKAAKGFGCWDQFVAMLFCQLAQARSLREIESGLKSCEGQLRHLGMKEAAKRSTLSYATRIGRGSFTKGSSTRCWSACRLAPRAKSSASATSF